MGRKPVDPSGAGTRLPLPVLLLLVFISCCLAYMAFSSSLRRSNSIAESEIKGGGVGSLIDEADECCRGMENLELWGSAVKWGTDHKFNSSVECCKACKAMCGGHDGPCLCDSWVFCGDRERCGEKFGEVILEIFGDFVKWVSNPRILLNLLTFTGSW